MSVRYDMKELAGEGGAGVVWRGWDRVASRAVAVKRLRSTGDSLLARETRTALRREAVALQSLNHPNIVTLLDSGEDAAGPFTVTEYLNGEDLETSVARAVLTAEDFCRLARQLLDGLSAIHRAGLIHRDIKPANVRLTWSAERRFEAKIIDFGQAEMADGRPLVTATPGERVWGTVQYMAPEQWEGGPATVQTDLFALGAVFYFCLTGRPPYRGENSAELRASLRRNERASLEKLRPDLPAALIGWVEWMVEPRPACRASSAEIARGVLDAFAIPGHIARTSLMAA